MGSVERNELTRTLVEHLVSRLAAVALEHDLYLNDGTRYRGCLGRRGCVNDIVRIRIDWVSHDGSERTVETGCPPA